MQNTNQISELRQMTGAGVLDCRAALDEAGGDMEKAAEILRKKGAAKAVKISERETREGLVHAYIHTGGKIGAMVELLCETDFVARTPEFQALAHDLTMHVAAANPLYLSPEDVPEEVINREKDIYSGEVNVEGKPEAVVLKILEGKMNKFFEEVCLLRQPFIKNEDITIGELLKQKIAVIGENIKIGRFIRFAL